MDISILKREGMKSMKHESKKKKEKEKEIQILDEALYLIKTRGTYRSTAAQFKVSKTTIQNHMRRLTELSPYLYVKVMQIVETNKIERSVRGGKAWKLKCLENKINNEGFIVTCEEEYNKDLLDEHTALRVYCDKVNVHSCFTEEKF